MTEAIVENPPEALGALETADPAGEAEDPDFEPEEPETGTGDVEDDEEGEGGTSDTAEAQAVRDQKEVDRVFDKVFREGERHAKRVEEILGADFGAVAPCPLCSHFAAGYLGLVELPEANILTVRAILGMPDLSNLEQAEDAHRCPRCNGKGRVKTDSSVPGYESKDCAGCNGIGWVGENAPAAVLALAAPDVPAVTGPTVYDTEQEDPQVQSLRERGFTVIPPMRLPSS